MKTHADTRPSGRRRRARARGGYLEDLIGGGVEAVGHHVVVQHQDGVHVAQSLELVVQVGGDLAQRLASLLTINY